MLWLCTLLAVAVVATSGCGFNPQHFACGDRCCAFAVVESGRFETREDVIYPVIAREVPCRGAED